MQQPVCIVLVSRSPAADPEIPALVRFRALPAGHRRIKFEMLTSLRLDADGWVKCPSDWRAPFLPESAGAWITYPALDDLFIYNGSGVMPGRTWIIAPDLESLRWRWEKLISAPADQKEAFFHPHLRNGQPGDKHSKRVVAKGLPGYEPQPIPVADDQGPCNTPVRYGFRSFDRQWIIPDNRLINQPNPELWEICSEQQVYLTAPSDRSPTAGPALTFTGLIPDLHHYNGRGGRVFPLWEDANAKVSNIPSGLLAFLSEKYERLVTAEEFMAYIAAVVAHRAFTARFKSELVRPGLRVPLTASAGLFRTAAELGSTIIWLHTFGERFANPKRERPARPPRLPKEVAPYIPANGAISQDPAEMPDSIDYDEAKRRLLVGRGFVEGVQPQVWNYKVSGKQVLRQWFSYRKANRERPIIGDRRQPSKLGDIQPDHWLAEYTTELLNVLNVLGHLVELEQAQAELLEKICSGLTISAEELRSAGALRISTTQSLRSVKSNSAKQLGLLD